MRRVASPKDRKYLESLNLKALQKSRPKGDQDPKEYYKALQEEAKSGPLFNDKVLDTVEHLPDLPKPVSKWLGNMDDKELKEVDSQDLRLIIDWVQGSEDADIEGLSWDDAMEAQQNWHDQLHDNKEDCGEYETHKVVFSTGGYDFVDLTTDHDLQVEGCKLKHCVGGSNYCRAVKNNDSRIISMRNSKNEPLVTIQYRTRDKSVVQCYGYKNHPPARKLNDPLVKFFEHMKWYDGLALLSNYTIPDDKLELLMSTENGARSLATNKRTPAAILAKLADHPARYVRLLVAEHVNTTPEVLDILSKQEHLVALYVATNPRTSTATLVNILKSTHTDDTQMLSMLCSNPNMPPAKLAELANNKDSHLRVSLAGNTSTPAETLDMLATSNIGVVRSSVAANPSTSVATLEKLARNPDTALHVLMNPTTTIELLRKMTDHFEYDEETASSARVELRKRSKKSASLRKTAQTLRGIL